MFLCPTILCDICECVVAACVFFFLVLLADLAFGHGEPQEVFDRNVDLWGGIKNVMILAIVLLAMILFIPGHVYGITDGSDVTGIQDLCEILEQQEHLCGWKPDGDETRGNAWTGLTCFGSDMICRDVSPEYNRGEIPCGLTPNATHMISQNKKFTGSVILLAGSVILLADPPLVDSNVRDSNFSRVISKQFQGTPRLWMGGSKFHIGENYVLRDYPVAPVTNEASAIETYAASHKVVLEKKTKLGSPGGIAVLVSCAALIVAIRVSKYRAERLESLENNCKSFPQQESPREFNLNPPAHRIKSEKMPRRSFFEKYIIPGTVKLFTVAKHQPATNTSSEVHRLGEGSLGSVNKAEFPDGQIVSMKIINTVALYIQEQAQILDAIWNDALHCQAHKPISCSPVSGSLDLSWYSTSIGVTDSE